MTFSVTGIVLSVLILFAVTATAVLFGIYRFAPGTGFPGLLNNMEGRFAGFIKEIQSEQISVHIPSISLIVLLVEIFLVIPLIISGFYLKIAYVGALGAFLFNSILITCLIHIWKSSNGMNIDISFLVMSIDRIRIKLRIGIK